jgi:AraC-like DNA-binding protein
LAEEAAMVIAVSTDGMTAGDRKDFWHDACARTFVGVDVHGVPDESLGGSVRAYDLGDLVVGEIDASGQAMTRTQRLIDTADEQYFLLAMQTRGMGRVAVDDQRTLLHAGGCVVLESHRPFELHFDSSFDLCVFGFPRDLVGVGERDRRRLAAREVDCRMGLAGVASRALLDLARHGEDLDAVSPGRALSLANDLVVSLLTEHVSQSGELRGAQQRTLPMRLKHYIDQSLSDPCLGPAQVAAEFGISTRYLHKLFETEEVTVAAYIRDRRLERCRLQLLDPRFAAQSIATVAFGCGFGDLSGFNRLFKAKYGMSPRQLQARSD